MVNTAPHLAPTLITGPLEQIRAWRLPTSDDLADLHRGVLRTLGALDSLAQLELPLEVPAARDPSEMAEWALVSSLLEQAEGALADDEHLLRVRELQRAAPGHAMQLERLRSVAVDRMRQLRARVDFVCGASRRTARPRVTPTVVRARRTLH